MQEFQLEGHRAHVRACARVCVCVCVYVCVCVCVYTTYLCRLLYVSVLNMGS